MRKRGAACWKDWRAPDCPAERLLSNFAEMLWRHYRREVTHCGLFESIDALFEATRDFFERMNRAPERTRSIIGAHPA